MKPHLQYLWYVLRHKWYVFKAGRILGLPTWQLLIHDLSKLSRAEWKPYVAKFFGGSPLTPTGQMRFDDAWQHHWTRNPHHWQYWRTPEADDGTRQAKPMPKRYTKEMVADWYGAGMANGRPDVAGWYKDNQYKMLLHDDTRADVIYYLDWLSQRRLISRGWVV